MKKICFIVAVPESAHAFLKDHFAHLVKTYEVHLVANFPKEESKQEFLDLGVFCHTIAIQRKIRLINDLKTLRCLKDLFQKESFECVHSVTPKAGLLTALAGKKAKIPHRIHIFTGQVWATRKGFMRFFLKSMDKVIAKHDTNILVDGKSQRLFLIKEGVLDETNSSVLANGSICGVKMEHFTVSNETRQNERKKLNLQPDQVVFAFMGRLNHDKGIGELFQAFDKLAIDCPNSVLLLYGLDEEGYDKKIDDYPNIKRNINYFYPGHTNMPFDSLQAADVFVLPTWREGFGSSVIEAQALCLPVITSDAYGVCDASIPNETGLRCGVDDPIGLYDCMKTYYEHPEMRKQHGIAGRKRVETLFSNNLVTKAWIDYYHDLLK